MKIYTKTGDKGDTMLFGGGRVAKHHLRIEAYGTVDELNAFIGLLRDGTTSEAERETLLQTQKNLFVVGSMLAANPEKKNAKPPTLPEAEVEHLEREMDRLTEQLPELRYFVLPGGHPLASQAHLARTVCRRAERRVTEIDEREGVEPVVVRYLNRLSDYLFVLSRYFVHLNGAEEVKWIPEG